MRYDRRGKPDFLPIHRPAMLTDRLSEELFAQICHIPLIDPHTHIDPRQPVARSLADLLDYHYYTELAHSTGTDRSAFASSVEPRERVRAVVYAMAQFDNTMPYQWFLGIARAFFNFQGERVGLADCAWLWDRAEKLMSRPDWEERVFKQSNLEKVFLTNEFDDPLEGFNTSLYVPCLRTDDLVFGLRNPSARSRLAKVTGIEIGDAESLCRALGVLFEHFARHEARACAISLPPDFAPEPVSKAELDRALLRDGADATLANGVFWLIAEHCQTFKLPFNLMIGVRRRVFEKGVPQGQDLFDQRASLMQYARLFNAFPEVTFCVSVLSSGLNQELVSFGWIFPNVIPCGHWWYSNLPAYIGPDLRARLQGVPKTKQIGYYSDMYKLEFALPKFNMYRRVLAQVIADDFVRPRLLTEIQGIELARFLLRDNTRRIYNV
jgi:glucuronate isomerase